VITDKYWKNYNGYVCPNPQLMPMTVSNTEPYNGKIIGLISELQEHFVSFHECLHRHRFEPVNCIIIGKMKSLQTIARKHSQMALIHYMWHCLCHLTFTLFRRQSPTCVDLRHRGPGHCENNSVHTMCDQDGQNLNNIIVHQWIQ